MQDSITTPLTYSVPKLVKIHLKTTFGNSCKGDGQTQQEWECNKVSGSSFSQDYQC